MVNDKLTFIINPKAGIRRKVDVESRIQSLLSGKINIEIKYWNDPDQDPTGLAKKAIQEGATVVVSAGGDGTVNAVATGLIGTNASLGIIPLGSGNGLARHLGIPMDTDAAILNLLNGKRKEIDSCSINGHPFFCTGGTGFDAHIGAIFANAKKRGFFTYVKLTAKEFFRYKANDYLLNIDGKEISVKAFTVTFANANQWGNNVFIAPMADNSDGIINVCILKPMNVFQTIGTVVKLFKGTIPGSRNFLHFTGKHITVTCNQELSIHYDGEPSKAGNSFSVSILPKSLKVIIPGK